MVAQVTSQSALQNDAFSNMNARTTANAPFHDMLQS
jgi:hypothetical protein